MLFTCLSFGMESCFEGGLYQGYEVRLQLVRNGGERKPYLVHHAQDVFRLMRSLGEESAEFMYSVNLDGAHQVVGVYLVAKGSCNNTRVDPKEVYKSALVMNCQDFILVHNHPSGVVKPSRPDVELTARVHQGGELLGLRCLDSIIIGDNGYFSMQDEGVVLPRHGFR